MYVALLTIVLCVAPGEAPDTVVVCPRPLRAALAPWVEYRRSQEHRVAFVLASQAGDGIRTRDIQLGKLALCH